ncbi:MAG: glycogen debranching N-terminal domain-containing protein [Candidatus Eisenbacteria bacterium]|nr:amylo-alpha-1,6-glucosidase [Candidatus Eisenbacteria bacterium]
MESIESQLDNYYILATAGRADERTRVLKQGDSFGVFDHYGDLIPGGMGEQGLYHQGTRFLSSHRMQLGNLRPLLLSSTVREENDLLAVDLTNPDLLTPGGLLTPRGTIHLFRSKFLWKCACHERVRLSNYAAQPLELLLVFRMDADYADIFEVRGTRRARRGERLPVRREANGFSFGYRGLDGVVRRTDVSFDPQPDEIEDGVAAFHVRLAPQQSMSITSAIRFRIEGSPPPPSLSFEQAVDESREEVDRRKRGGCAIETSSGGFNSWVRRSLSDLHMMVTPMPTGPYPYAGIPWFSTPFGRDGILTALQTLWIDPALARGVLSYLAATQAQAVVPEQDAEPGKILHEARSGEMAALGEVPFGRYYGSVDSTPLFLILAGAYYRRTGDLEFVRSLEGSIEAALRWIDCYGDRDGDGFVEYQSRTPRGLAQQGWKDSQDSVFHADGSPAEGPIALCEVQGYVYAAWRAAARIHEACGREERAEGLRARAEAFRERFAAAFWCPDIQTYALALDGTKQPCRVRTSNAGHLLWSRICDADRARKVAFGLLSRDFYTGWGVRTVAASEARYNPMSYHNGSVWPHDNAILALGLCRYGLTDLALQPMTGLYEVSRSVDLHRMPELFCGFPRRSGEGPTLYPVACAPQAWSAAAVFSLLAACLGLAIDSARAQEVRLHHSLLPAFLDWVRIENLRVGSSRLSLLLERHANNVGIEILSREGDVQIIAVK